MGKLTVEFNAKMDEILTELATEKGTSKAEVLRRAVALYRYLTRESESGKRVLISDSTKEIKEKEIVLP